MLCRANEYEFRFLAISPESWDGGVGQALVAVCEVQAISHGAEQIVMSVVELNEQAFRFYSPQGYSRMPERDWSPPRSSRCFTVPNPVRC